MLVVGSVNLDLVMHVNLIPAVGETVSGIGYDESLGGKGANQAVGAARLGANVQMIGRVGSDSYGQRLLEGMRAAGVDVSSVVAASGPSGIAVILHAENGDNSIVVQAGANNALRADELSKHLEQIRSAAIVLLQLESPLDTVLLAAQMAQMSGVPVVLDPAPARTLPPELLHSTTWLTPNETEAATLLGGARKNDTPSAIAEGLLALGARNVVLKLGERGAFLAGKDCTPMCVPAFKVHAVDTTAAGDCFNAAFASRLVHGDSPAAAALYANVAAAFCVTRAGAQAAMPTAAEVAEFLSSAHIEAQGVARCNSNG